VNRWNFAEFNFSGESFFHSEHLKKPCCDIDSQFPSVKGFCGYEKYVDGAMD
jgi:hypothetical protein